MATDLEIRVTAELSAIRQALTSLTGDIGKVNDAANKGGGAANGLADGMDNAAKKAKEASSSTKQLATDADRAKGSLTTLLAGLGVVGLARSLIQMADTATLLRGQLELVTKSTEELNVAQEQTFAIAQRTRAGLQGTVNLYASIARAGRTTQEQTLALTETINKAVALSFTSAQSAEAALFQLGQAISVGVLRGQDLNSVMSQTPRLATAIAQGLVKMGVIAKETDLRKYANEQGIAIDDVIKALQLSGTTLEEEFAKIPPTVGGAMTAVRNAVLQYVGTADQANGSSRQLADLILLVSKHIDDLAAALIAGAKIWLAYKAAFVWLPGAVGALTAQTAAAGAAGASAAAGVESFAAAEVAAGTAARVAAPQVAAMTAQLTLAEKAARSLGLFLGSLPRLLVSAFTGYEIGSYLVERFTWVQKAGIQMARVIHTSLVEMAGGAKAIWAEIAEAAKQSFNAGLEGVADLLDAMGKVSSITPGIGSKLEATYAGLSAKIRGAKAETVGFGAAWKTIDAEVKARVKSINESYQALYDAAGKIDKPDAPKPAAPDPDPDHKVAKAIGGIVDQYELMKDAADRALKQISQLYADNLISIKDYYKQKADLERQGIDAQISAAKRQLADARADAAAAVAAAAKGDADAQAKAEKAGAKAVGDALTKIIVLQRARADIGVQAAHDQAKAEQDLADKLADVRTRLMELDGDAAGAKTRTLEAQYKDLIARLKAESDTAGVELVHKLINTEAAKAALDQYKDQFSQTTTALSQLQATTAAQVTAGLLSNATAEKRIQEARDKALEQLKQQRAAVAALYAEYGKPEALVALQQLDEQIATLSTSLDDWRGKTQDAATSSLANFFSDLYTRAKSAGEAVRDLAVNFTKSLADMASQALAKKAIGAIFDLFTKDSDDGGAGQVAAAAAAGVAYSAPVTTAAVAMGTAGGAVAAGGGVVMTAAIALQAAADTLLVANSIGTAAGVAHTGGIVGQLGAIRRGLSPALFIGAPRYHGGGVAGLGPDEVPTVLRRGEEVLTRNDPRHRYNAGTDSGDAKQPMRFIFVDDQRQVKNYLTGPEGEQTQIEFIHRNAGQIREILKG